MTNSIGCVGNAVNSDNNNFSINIFFDGTGNNGINAHALVKKAASETGLSDEDKKQEIDSYKSSFTNIYRLFLNASRKTINDEPESIVQLDNAYNIYVSGIGTKDGGSDNTFIQAVGDLTILEQLFNNKITKAYSTVHIQIPILNKFNFEEKYREYVASATTKINHLNKALTELEKDRLKGKNVQINLYGFSRGAALARYYANELNNENFKIIKGDNENLAVEINFLGLFDTVESIVFANTFKTAKSANVKNIANYCYHLTADHEARNTFPLTSIIDLSKLKAEKPNLDVKNNTQTIARYREDESIENNTKTSVTKKRLEINLAGAHADIGGGYLSNSKQVQSLSPYFFRERKLTERKEWYEKNEKWKYIFLGNLQTTKDKKNPLAKYITFNKKHTDARLQYVYFYMMAQAANAQGCCFDLGTINKDYIEPLPTNLKEYYHLLEVFNRNVIDGKDADTNLITAMLEKVSDYIHVSFNYDNPLLTKSRNIDDYDATPLKGVLQNQNTDKVLIGSKPTPNQEVLYPVTGITLGHVFQPAKDLVRELRFYKD